MARLSERLEEAYLDGSRSARDRQHPRSARKDRGPRSACSEVPRATCSSSDPLTARRPKSTPEGSATTRSNELAPRLLLCDEHSFGTDVLVVDIESPRSHYGRLAAFAPAGGFAEDDRQILASYASYAAAALDVLTALEQARRSNESASALLDFSRALAGVSTVDEVAQRLAETVPLVTGMRPQHRDALGPDGADAHGAGGDRTGRRGCAARTRRKRIVRVTRLHRDSTPLFEKVLEIPRPCRRRPRHRRRDCAIGARGNRDRLRGDRPTLPRPTSSSASSRPTSTSSPADRSAVDRRAADPDDQSR